MYANKITLKMLSSIMFEVYSKTQLDMGYYQPMFNGLISEMGFRFRRPSDLQGESFQICEGLFGSVVEDLFLDKINRMDINEKIFYDIAFEVIEPMKVDKLLPHSLIPANF